MADTHNEAEVKTKYPVAKGIETNQNHQGRQINLIPTVGSLTPKRLKLGMMD